MNLTQSNSPAHDELSTSSVLPFSVEAGETIQGAGSAASSSVLSNITVPSEAIAGRHFSVVNDARLMQSHSPSHVTRVVPFCLGSKPVRCEGNAINWEQSRAQAAEAVTVSGIDADSVYIDIDQAYFTGHPTQVIFSDSVSSCILVCARVLDDQGRLWRGIAHISPDPVNTHAFNQFIAGIRDIPARHTDVFLMGGLHNKNLYQEVAAWVKESGISIGHNSRHNPLNITKEQEDDIYHEAYFNLMIKKDGQIDWEGIV